jgi:transcriptional regulator with XRE-family HTH domain
MSFGKRLKELRLSHNMSQAVLAKNIGIGQSTIADYEKELNTPGSDNLVKIAQVFNVSLDYLLGLTTVKERNPDQPINMVNFVRPKINGKPATDKELTMLTQMMANLIEIVESGREEGKK